LTGEVQFLGIVIGIPAAIFWLLALLPRRAAVSLSIVAIAVTLYAVWVNVTDRPNPNYVDLGPFFRSIMALAALAGPLMALIFHLIGRRSWRWRLTCFAAGFPLGYGLIVLYKLF
jgi:hypothetical protein